VFNLLDLSRIEAGAYELSVGRVEVEEVLLSCLKSQSRAIEFNLSLRTSEGHINRILDKKNFSSRVEIPRYVLERKAAG
jgi:signal transduction histidine kinase